MNYANPSTYNINLTPQLVNMATEGGLDTSILNGKSLQRTISMVPVSDCEGDLKIIGNRKDGESFDNIVSSVEDGWITIYDTNWLYPVSNVNAVIEENEMEAAKTLVFENMTDLNSFYSDVFNSSAISQPVGNVGYSIGVGTKLRDLGVTINLTLKSGLRVVTWRLVEQLTSQNDVANGGDSPDGTIGFTVIYCDWDNNGKQDPLNLLPWNIGYEYGDPLRVEQLQKFVP